MPQIIEVPGHGQVEFPDGMTDQDITSAIQKNMAPAEQPASLADKMAGSWGGRILQGAASPVLAGVQMLGGEKGREMVSELDAMKKRGMAAEGKEGFDWYGLLGALAPGAGIAKGVASALPAATGLAGRMGVGAAQGAATAVAQPTDGGEDFWSQKGVQALIGGAAGGAIPAISAGIGKAVDVGKSFVEPVSDGGQRAILQRFQQKLLGNDPARIQAATQAAHQAQTLVPGSQPTTGEALAEVPGMTGLLAHQKSISRLPGVSPQFAERAAQQEAARAGAISQIAKTPSALEQAVQQRGQQAKALYGAAGQQTVQPTDAFAALMERPSMQKAAARASELAKEAGETFDPSSVKSLHYMKMAMDDLLKNPERFSIGATEAGAIGKTQQEFVRWLESQSPAYGTAREAFKSASGPINRMQVGQELERSLTTPLGTSERSGVFAKAVEDAPRTIKRATGQTMFDKIDEVLTPSETQAVKRVTEELARHDAFSRGARQTSLGGHEAIPGKVGLPLPNLLSRPAMLANFVMGKFGESAEEKIAKLAAQQYLDPKLFAAGQAPVPARYQPMIDALMRHSSGAAGTAIGRGN